MQVARLDNPPTLGTIANAAMKWFEKKQISLSDIAKGECGGTVQITASSGSTNVILNPVVSYSNPATTGSLVLTATQPVLQQFGSSTISVTANDGYNTPTIRTFSTSVQWVSPPHK